MGAENKNAVEERFVRQTTFCPQEPLTLNLFIRRNAFLKMYTFDFFSLLQIAHIVNDVRHIAHFDLFTYFKFNNILYILFVLPYLLHYLEFIHHEYDSSYFP